jgi:hypothetical protein
LTPSSHHLTTTHTDVITRAAKGCRGCWRSEGRNNPDWSRTYILPNSLVRIASNQRVRKPPSKQGIAFAMVGNGSNQLRQRPNNPRARQSESEGVAQSHNNSSLTLPGSSSLCLPCNHLIQNDMDRYLHDCFEDLLDCTLYDPFVFLCSSFSDAIGKLQKASRSSPYTRHGSIPEKETFLDRERRRWQGSSKSRYRIRYIMEPWRRITPS